MNKKYLSIVAISATFAITAAIIVMAVLYFQPRTVNAKSIASVAETNGNSAATNLTVPTNTPASKVKFPLVQKVNGVKMEVLGTASEGEYFTVDVCYDFPSQKTDYAFVLGGQDQSSMTLTAGSENISIYSWKVISGYDADANGNFQGNCARLYFPVSPSTDLTKLTLTISRMSTPLADVPDCAKAQKKLDDAKQNIKVKCGNDQNRGFSVSEKPADMDDDKAKAIAFNAFLDIVEGPWVFSLN